MAWGWVGFEMFSKKAQEERAQRFRKSAKELRAIAEGMADENTKQTLLKVASDYGQLALRAAAPGGLPDFTVS